VFTNTLGWQLAILALAKISIFATVLGFCWWVFANWAWRWRVFRLLGLVKIPDLNGTWQGIVKRDGKNETEHNFQIDVSQKFNAIVIKTKSTNSSGISIIAEFVTDENKSAFKLISHWETVSIKIPLQNA
jgi:hypothetical protein